MSDSLPSNQAMAAPQFTTSAQIMASLFDPANAQTYFSSTGQAVQWQNTLQAVSGQHDTTIPQDPARERQHVAVLVAAFKSVTSAKDNPGIVKPSEESKHDDRLIEVTCWHIYHTLVKRSTREGPLQHLYGIRTKPSAKMSFAQRFDATVRVLAEKKSICKGLLDPPAVVKLVDDPIRRLAKSEENQRGNKKKKNLFTIAAGINQTGTDSTRSTSSRKRSSATAFEEEDDDEDDDEYDAEAWSEHDAKRSKEGLESMREQGCDVESSELRGEDVEGGDDGTTYSAVEDEQVESSPIDADAEEPEARSGEFEQLLQQFLEERQNLEE